MATVDEVMDLLGTRLDEADLDALAQRVHLSRFHLHRLLTAALGEPPGALRRRLLLERAAHRLVTTDETVVDLSVAAGYDSPDGFTRAFSRAFGMPPSDYRRTGRVRHRIPAPSGIHFHPPGGLALPALVRSDPMDTLVRMLDHHLDTTAAVLARLDRVPDALDRPITLSVEGIDEAPTLRSTCDRLVRQLEQWVVALEGGTSIPAGDATPAGLRRRLEAVAPRFREQVVAQVVAGNAESTFLDLTCDPPQTFTLGGVLAHVLTFAAVRRTIAIGALETAGVGDLGSGDPMAYVGGAGPDASTVHRRFDEP
ncbi:AraC family transcriptional regulator [Amnibacterium sp.]|uniref:helix-turn-helix domain-containing protein n=1 Tax=Amnibacterium sp. TaxID=1872496 RepID=UPI00260AB159|nr:AraC family transcriptional regulator [Amnibacterium sp.]MCU1474094.1 helix-turn-helix transcriptional regulator [Amnibacterium sp.]